MPTRPRRVDFLTDLDDFHVLMFGVLGKSTKFITNKTHLTPCQVSYRLAKGKVKRADYRDGTSSYDRMILQACETDVTRALRAELERQFGRNGRR